MRLIKTEYRNYYSPDDPGERGYDEVLPRYSVTDEEVEILSKLASGKNVLEIGTGLGVSTRALAKTAIRVVSVDIDPWTHSFAFPSNVKLVKTIPDEHFELVFIDGLHKFESVVADIETCKGDLFVLHDCYLEGVALAIQYTALVEQQCFNTVCDMRSFRKKG